MVLATLVFGIIAALLKWVGVPRSLIYDATPYVTLALVVYSGYEACRRLLLIYDIRLQGDHSGEQNHRHRR